MFKCRNMGDVQQLTESLTKREKVKNGVKVFLLKHP